MSTSEGPSRGTGSRTPPSAPGTAQPGGAPGAPLAPRASSAESAAGTSPRSRTSGQAGNMLPGRSRRRFGFERLLVRLIATAGIIGIGVALGAILVSSHVHGWIVGLVVAIVSVILSAVLWSSRQL